MFQPLTNSLCILAMSLSLLFPGPEFALPAHETSTVLFSYPGYTLSYNEKFEQADWVAYELTKEEATSKVAERDTKFRPDPQIPSGSASDEDYKKSGYDRGHLAPAADMKFSQEAMYACFYYSNMSPQNPSFNRGIWASLESLVRFWAIENGAVYVVTGPVLDKTEYPVIGPNQVAVPEYFYKIILDYRLPERKAIGFIIPNTKATKNLADFECSVDTVEKITGIDFFPLINDTEEAIIEANFNPDLWPLSSPGSSSAPALQ